MCGTDPACHQVKHSIRVVECRGDCYICISGTNFVRCPPVPVHVSAYCPLSRFPLAAAPCTGAPRAHDGGGCVGDADDAHGGLRVRCAKPAPSGRCHDTSPDWSRGWTIDDRLHWGQRGGRHESRGVRGHNQVGFGISLDLGGWVLTARAASRSTAARMEQNGKEGMVLMTKSAAHRLCLEALDKDSSYNQSEIPVNVTYIKSKG
eukprot:930592-Rhodomonas_salina.1